MYDKNEKIKIPLGHYFWVFLIASVIGTYYEEIIHIINHFFKYYEFDYSRRSGLFWGPISLVYGIGAVLFLILLGRKKRTKKAIFIESALLGGLAEYLMSFIQELLTGTASWAYSEKLLNINGRTTIIFMLGWGLAGLILIVWLYPKIDHLLFKMNDHLYKTLTIALSVLVFLDLTITWTAIARSELKEKGIPPSTFIGEFYDENFDKEYIQKKFPNTEETD